MVLSGRQNWSFAGMKQLSAFGFQLSADLMTDR
jgi:hypothetical protein